MGFNPIKSVKKAIKKGTKAVSSVGKFAVKNAVPLAAVGGLGYLGYQAYNSMGPAMGGVGGGLGDYGAGGIGGFLNNQNIAGPLIGAAGSYIGSNQANAMNKDLMQDSQAFNSAEAIAAREFNSAEALKQRKFSNWQAKRQMDFQERMSNTATQRQMADLKAAGINPILAGGYGGSSSPGGSAGSGGQASGPAASGSQSQAIDEITPALSSAINVAQAQAQIKATNANTANLNAQTGRVKAETTKIKRQSTLGDYIVEQIKGLGRLGDEIMPTKQDVDAFVNSISSNAKQVEQGSGPHPRSKHFKPPSRLIIEVK